MIERLNTFNNMYYTIYLQNFEFCQNFGGP